MKKIAILGCENSHASAFIKCIKEDASFSDVEVVGVYSDEKEAMEKLNEKYAVAMMDDFTDAVGKIDGLVITARHGDNHYRYAKPYIQSGIPMFIDKPITVKEEEALEFMRELKKNSVPVCGGSSLKQDEFVKKLKLQREAQEGGRTVSGLVRAPLHEGSEYGGFYFYAQHLVEMICEIFGRYPKSVTAKRNFKTVHVIFSYGEFDCVGLYCEENNVYYASRVSEESTVGFDIPFTKEWYFKEFGEFYRLLCGEKQSVSYEDFISPVFIMNAIERSLASGKEEEILKYEV